MFEKIDGKIDDNLFDPTSGRITLCDFNIPIN